MNPNAFNASQSSVKWTSIESEMKYGNRFRLSLLCAWVSSSPAMAQESASQSCTYELGIWNVAAGKVLERKRIDKPKSELRPEEIDEWGCTPCIEDQVSVTLSNGVSFQMCTRLAEPVREALEKVLESGLPIDTVVGYRPSMSKGPVDARQNRTQLSNHAFGSALDINEAHNGLYTHCLRWSPSCRLIRGGPWQPGSAHSLTADHPVVREMMAIGFLWGGEIQGIQKDMMHFSKSGY